MDYSWLSSRRASIVCVGNELNGDDGFGARLFDKLKNVESPRLQVIYAATAPENFIDVVLEFKPELVVVFDAADFHGTPGEVRQLSLDDIESTSFSTHRSPMKLFSRFFSKRGIPVKFIGVQVRKTGLGEKMTREVEKAADDASKSLIKLFS